MPEVIEDVTYLTKKEVANRCRVTTRSIEAWVAAGKFPSPYKPTYKTALWNLADIVAHETAVKKKCGL